MISLELLKIRIIRYPQVDIAPFLRLLANSRCPFFSSPFSRLEDNGKGLSRLSDVVPLPPWRKTTIFLQHLEFKGHPTSFVMGPELVGWTTPPQERGPWGLRALGFTDLQISKEEVVVRHIGKDATLLYEVKKPVDIMERS